ncbi:MAG TPA: MlaD family protein [Verrucomicrobiae bacterium]|jgi:ABC-type transporter Mla subunit MlaD|nr:MlaD family protein [Verrucomicrobiae bacterium]
MALQDLTPQLRTRLSRMERAVGWFVMLATALLLFGFGFYVYKTAERKGWFTPKFKYQTSLNDASGLKVGDPVTLMGFQAGEITEITPNEPDAYFGVTIKFTILKPHYGYIWDDSRVSISSDLLGHRMLQITKGASGIPTIEENTNKAPQAMLRWKIARTARKKVLAEVTAANPEMAQTNHYKFNWLVKDELTKIAQADPTTFYTNLTDIYWIAPDESPALTERLQKVVDEVENALPGILNLTNQIASTLSSATALTSNLNTVAVGVQPTVSNLTLLTGQLNHPGALGDWLLPTNVNAKLDSVMGNADAAVANLNTNLANLNLSLLHLADLTSNLNTQVQVNTNILSNVSKAVGDADDFVQGLKRHWLLRSAFKKENKKENTDSTPSKTAVPALSPKAQDNR